MNEFGGKTAIVTGAGSGIGRATAALLAERGALVAVCDIDAERAAATVQEITTAAGRAVAYTCDVSRSEQVDETVDDFVSRFGVLDICVNNAGVIRSVPGHAERRADVMARRAAGEPGGSLGVTVNMSDEIWRLHLSVMLDGVFFGARAALRHMEPRQRGAIINTASIGAFHPAPDYPAYAAAKAGVVAFTRSVGHEVAGAGIRVNAVAPGSTATAIMAGSATGSFSSRNACGRIGDPHEIAEVIAFLASERASFCFGEIFTVSGAWA